MSLPRNPASLLAFRSLLGAHSFPLGQAAWHCRPSCVYAQLKSRSLKSSSVLRGLQPQEQHRPRGPSLSSQFFRSSQNTAVESALASCYTQQSSPAVTDEEKESQRKHSITADSTAQDSPNQSLPLGWEENADYNIQRFSDLPHRFFGHNQHIRVNEDFKESLRQVLWQFRAPIRYAFAYGSGVFGQKSSSSSTGSEFSPHPNPPKSVQEWQKGGGKIIDFIFGVSHTQHWHSINLQQHPNHYSGLKYLPYSSAAVSWVQDKLGAGMYYNPYITVNGIMIKYGVVQLDTLARDLTEWDTLYLAGRLQKPVKILRDDPRMRLSNQINLVSALRTACLMLPKHFNERQLYERITSLSYLGDPRMHSMIASESPNKASNIVGAQLPGFRQLYVPLIENLPNVEFTDSRTPKNYGWEKEDAVRHTGTLSSLDDVLGGEEGLSLSQDMDPVKRGNMVRRLPKAFRQKLYYQYKGKFQIPGNAFDDIMEESQDDNPEGFKRREGGEFERRIAEQADLPEVMASCVGATVSWPAAVQSMKGILTSGITRSLRYVSEKRAKGKERKRSEAEASKVPEGGSERQANAEISKAGKKA